MVTNNPESLDDITSIECATRKLKLLAEHTGKCYHDLTDTFSFAMRLETEWQRYTEGRVIVPDLYREAYQRTYKYTAGRQRR